MVIPLVSRVVIAGAAPLVVTALFSFKEQKMARYLRHQDEIKIEILKDGDLKITQTDVYADESIIFINITNIDWFTELILMAKKDGYQGDGE